MPVNNISMSLFKKVVFNLRNHARLLSAAPKANLRLDDLDLDFNSPEEAFKSKTTGELVRAYLVYQLCSCSWLVDNNDMLMKKMQKYLGIRIFEFFMKMTFYGQFVAGKDQEEIKPTVERLRSFGVKSILDYSVEEDVSHEEAESREVRATTPEGGDMQLDGQIKKYHVDKKFADRRYKVTSVRTYFYQNEATCEKNTEAFLRSIRAVAEVTHSQGLMAVKLTALGRPQLLLQLSEVIMRARNYMEQMGTEKGKSLNVLTHHKTKADFQRYFGDNVSKPEVQHFLENITSDKAGVVHLFPWSDILDKDMRLSDTFRVPDPKTGQMRRLISQISSNEEAMFRNMLRRLRQIIDAANEVDCRLMIDAEQSYFQPAISRICMELMKRYNQKKFLIFNTYQTYLKESFNELVTDLEQAKRQDFYWGAKLVRGAYLEQERARAQSMGYPDPTCPSFNATTASFNKALNEVLRRAQDKEPVGVMVASHNEGSVRYAIELMQMYSIRPEQKVLCFGQLLGMCDHVTFPLGQAGYSAYKYVPYGPVIEVLPYLSRRAKENRGFLKKIKKEKRLLRQEILRRVIKGQMFYKPVGNYKPV